MLVDFKSARTDSYYVPQKLPKARKFSFYFEHGLLGLNGFYFSDDNPKIALLLIKVLFRFVAP